MSEIKADGTIFLSQKIDKKPLYFVTETVGGSQLNPLPRHDDSALVKVKIDRAVFNHLKKKKFRHETIRMALQRAILSML